MGVCERCGGDGERKFVSQVVADNGECLVYGARELLLCTRCWLRRSPRPLSPYEALTGHRFRDHLSALDATMDRYLA